MTDPKNGNTNVTADGFTSARPTSPQRRRSMSHGPNDTTRSRYPPHPPTMLLWSRQCASRDAPHRVERMSTPTAPRRGGRVENLTDGRTSKTPLSGFSPRNIVGGAPWQGSTVRTTAGGTTSGPSRFGSLRTPTRSLAVGSVGSRWSRCGRSSLAGGWCGMPGTPSTATRTARCWPSVRHATVAAVLI
jgi:hypothetical protein